MDLAGRDLADPGKDPLGDRRIEERLAAPDRLQRRHEVARPDLLEQVAGRTRHDRRQDRLVVRERGQHDDARVGQVGPDLAAGLDPGAVGQADIHDHDVRAVEARLGQRLLDRAGLGHDLERRSAVEQGHQALADDLVIIDDQQPEGTAGRAAGGNGALFGHRCCLASSVVGSGRGSTTTTLVPSPGVLRISS